MGLKKKVAGQWVSDSGVDVKIDNTSVMSGDVASIATTGSYDGDETSPNYNPISTKDYVDQAIEDLPEPMVWTGVISITADSTDTTKCAISVSAPASATDIKKGFTYKVSFIAASPEYTGTIKIGDTLIAAKDAPKVDKTWVEDTDWNYVPSGDETGFLIGVASGTSENQLVSFGVNGYTAKNSGVSVKASTTAMSGSSDAEVPTSKNIATNVAKTATISSGYSPAQAQAAIAAGDTIEQALGKLEKEADDNKNNISSVQNIISQTYNSADCNISVWLDNDNGVGTYSTYYDTAESKMHFGVSGTKNQIKYWDSENEEFAYKYRYDYFGLIGTNNVDKSESLTIDIPEVNNETYVKKSTTSDSQLSPMMRYTWNKSNVNVGDVWYIRPYVLMNDLQFGNQFIKYGAVYKVTAGTPCTIECNTLSCTELTAAIGNINTVLEGVL